jgi:hypothetical protein
MKNLDAFQEHGDILWNIANFLRGPDRPPQHRRVEREIVAMLTEVTA